MRDAVLLALSFTQGSGTQEVVIIGDGAYGERLDIDMQRGQIRHLQVAGGEKNVGITRMALRKVLEATDAYEILIAVKNFSSQSVDVPLHVTTVLRKGLLERRLQLKPGQEEVIVATLTGPLKGTVQADIVLRMTCRWIIRPMAWWPRRHRPGFCWWARATIFWKPC